MAEAKRATKTVETVVTEEVEVISLDLSQEEADAIRAILGKCSAGGPTHAVYQALCPLTGGSYRVTHNDDWDTRVPLGTIRIEKV